MSDVFISYSRKDSAFAQRLAADLKAAGLVVFYDELIQPGDSWQEAISAAIEGARFILPVLSPDYLASQWAQTEWQAGLAREFTEQVKVIPLMARECRLEGLLATKVYVDFTVDYDQALRRLLTALQGKAPGPDLETGPPPGDLAQEIKPADLERLRAELQEAVALFKAGPSRREDFGPAPQRPSGRRKCFIVMPFGDSDLQIVYEDFVRPVIQEACELDCERGDDVFGSNVIMDDIRSSIDDADLVVADLTGKNANVFYEVGICHTVGKPVLLMAQSIDDVPFDLRHHRILLYEYSPRGCKKLEKSLKENLLAMLKRMT